MERTGKGKEEGNRKEERQIKRERKGRRKMKNTSCPPTCMSQDILNYMSASETNPTTEEAKG